jgi:(2Fe-2S) ferredoxin
MSKQQQKLVRPLICHFLGWGDDRIPHRYVKVATAMGQQVLKIPKSLRPQIQDWQLGVWLTLLIQERVNATTGKTKIKVKQLLTSPGVSILDNLPKIVTSQVKIEQQPAVTDSNLSPEVYMPDTRSQIRVCQGSSCRRRGSAEICKSMQAYLDQSDLHDRVEIKPVKCLHQCKAAPHAIVTSPATAVIPGKTHYRQLQQYQVKAILDRHFPPATPTAPIDYNLVKKISNYLQRQIVSTTSVI